jgi:hypothetical protein
MNKEELIKFIKIWAENSLKEQHKIFSEDHKTRELFEKILKLKFNL